MSLFPKLRAASVTVIVISFMIIMIIRLYRLVNPSRLGRKVAINSRRPLQTDHRHRHSMNEFRTQLKDQAASFVWREKHEHAQLSRQVKNISAFTPDRSPNLGLVRVLERAIKEAKPRQTCALRIGSEPRKRVVRQGTSRFHFVPVCSGVPQTGTKWNLDGCRAGARSHLRFIPCWARGRRPGRVQSSTVQSSTVQGSTVQGSTVQGSTVQTFNGPLFSRLPSSLFKGCDRVQLCCLCYLL